MATIWIYQTNPALAHKLCDSFQKEQYDAVVCNERTPILPEKAGQPPLVLLDAQMKWTACRPLLERFSQLGCPILFVTGDRKMSSHLRALYAGRSDVLIAPFSSRQLMSKARALLGEQRPAKSELSLDESERVALLDGRRVELTAQEYALLLALMEKPDVPVSREQLLRKAWGYQSMGETRTVDVHVQRLRKKLGFDYIETVYKCGYRLKLA